MLRVGIWVESFRCAGILLLQWQGENFALRQHLKFCHLQPVHCSRKIPYVQSYSADFWNLYLSSKMLRVAIWVEISGTQEFLFCNGKVKTLRIDNIWNCATFHLKTVPAKILCLQKYSIDFRNLSVSSKMLRVGIWWKVSGAQVFNFAMARWNLCASTTFEVLLLSTCTLCQQKSYISKAIQPTFEIFPSARRCWRWEFGWQVSGTQEFYFCNGKMKTLRIDNISNLATFNLYTVQAEILYLQRYSNNFRNLSLGANMLTMAIWVESFRCAGILLLQSQCENFAHRQHFKFCHFQHVHYASKNYMSPKVFNRFSKSFRHFEDVEGGHLGGKFQVRRYFTFAMARWKLCASTTFEILPLSTCTVCQQKSYISKDIQPIFEIVASARRFWGSALGWKVSGAQVFYFWNGEVKILRIDNIWTFATFNLYTMQAEILYLQRYSTDFRNRCLLSKMLRVAIWVENFRCGGI